MEPIKYVYDETSIPTNFDARTKWPSKIHPVQNQGWCGSDWAFTTSAITGDFDCISLFSHDIFLQEVNT